MSVIETPPRDRLAIQTSIVKFSTDVDRGRRSARSSRRDGQVFFVHNRVESIYSLAEPRAAPGARRRGSRSPTARCRRRSSSGSCSPSWRAARDVLVATTIVENGLDIPRANTLHRQPRRPLRPRPALPAARPRRPLRPPGLRLPPRPARHRALRDRAQAPRRDPRVLRPRRRLPHRRPRPRAARRRQPARRPAERPHPGRRARPLRQAARAGDPGAARASRRGEAPRAALHLRVEMRIPPDYVPETHQRLSIYKRVSQLRQRGRGRAAAGRAARPLRPAPARGGGPAALRGAARPRRGARRHPGGRARRRRSSLRFDARTPLQAGRPRAGGARAAGRRAPARRPALAARRARSRWTPWAASSTACAPRYDPPRHAPRPTVLAARPRRGARPRRLRGQGPRHPEARRRERPPQRLRAPRGRGRGPRARARRPRRPAEGSSRPSSRSARS